MAQRVVVVGMDGTPGGRRALDWAVRHAVETGATVEAVTAYSLEGTDWFDPASASDEREYVDNRQQEDIAAALEGLEAPPRVHRVVVKADAVQALTRAARTADLLVLGSHGRGHLSTAVLGSVAERCIRHGATPVLVVPGGH